MKKIMTLIIVVSLLFPSGALFAKERQGAQLEITKTDGTKIKGELIGVKQDSALLLESSSKIGGSIDISEVTIIKVVKGSNTGAGVLLGLLAGGVAGAIIGKSIGHDPNPGMFGDLRGGINAMILGGMGLFAGGLLGGGIGSSIRNYETLQIEGNSQEQIRTVLEKLRTQARFPEYQ